MNFEYPFLSGRNPVLSGFITVYNLAAYFSSTISILSFHLRTFLGSIYHKTFQNVVSISCFFTCLLRCNFNWFNQFNCVSWSVRMSFFVHCVLNSFLWCSKIRLYPLLSLIHLLVTPLIFICPFSRVFKAMLCVEGRDNLLVTENDQL